MMPTGAGQLLLRGLKVLLQLRQPGMLSQGSLAHSLHGPLRRAITQNRCVEELLRCMKLLHSERGAASLTIARSGVVGYSSVRVCSRVTHDNVGGVWWWCSCHENFSHRRLASVALLPTRARLQERAKRVGIDHTD